MAANFEEIYDRLYEYCKARDFAGYDPFDGLNSRVFQLLPLRYFAAGRLAWLQLVKRSPVDLRRPALVSPGVNPKALALFALAELCRFRTNGDRAHSLEASAQIEALLRLGIGGKSPRGEPTLAFGYNFDWQSRYFFAPAGTPAIIPTAFASQALIEAWQTIGDEIYLQKAVEICEFILASLNRPVETDGELCFSYTPGDGTIIFNASLLAGESLARAGAATGNREYLELAAKTARFAIRRQRADGAWVYGLGAKQDWVDNFHTAYVLVSLHRIAQAVPELEGEAAAAVESGIDYWLGHFFLDDGAPKYYDKSKYPVDIHSAAVATAAMCELKNLDARLLPLAERTAEWTIENMCGPSGYFYYQRRPHRVIKTPFMRWGQAWMAYALARLIESKSESAV